MPAHKSREEKALETHRAATAVLDLERADREKKTARLRALRLAKETVEKVRGRKR